MSRVGPHDRTRMMGNKRGYLIYCRVSLPVNMFNNIRKIFLKKDRDVVKKMLHRSRSPRLLNPSNNYSRIFLDNEMVNLKDHPSINNPSLDTSQLSDRDGRFKEKMLPRSQNVETRATNDQVSISMSADDVSVEVDREGRKWGTFKR